MALDLSPFRKAVSQLASGLAAARAAPGDELMRDGVIQRFEHTYELTHEFLRRFLEETEPAPDEIREMSFPALIRLGSERGLLVNGWDVWTDHRKARGTTSQTYDGVKAAEVFARIPAFLDDARALLAALDRRLRACLITGVGLRRSPFRMIGRRGVKSVAGHGRTRRRPERRKGLGPSGCGATTA